MPGLVPALKIDSVTQNAQFNDLSSAQNIIFEGFSRAVTPCRQLESKSTQNQVRIEVESTQNRPRTLGDPHWGIPLAAPPGGPSWGPPPVEPPPMALRIADPP